MTSVRLYLLTSVRWLVCLGPGHACSTGASSRGACRTLTSLPALPCTPDTSSGYPWKQRRLTNECVFWSVNWSVTLLTCHIFFFWENRRKYARNACNVLRFTILKPCLWENRLDDACNMLWLTYDSFFSNLGCCLCVVTGVCALCS